MASSERLSTRFRRFRWILAGLSTVLLLAGGAQHYKAFGYHPCCILFYSYNSASWAGLVQPIQLAVEQFGDPIAKFGFKLTLESAEQSVANAARISADGSYLLLIVASRGVFLQELQIYQTVKLPVISVNNTLPLLTESAFAKDVYRVIGRADVQAVVAAEFAKSRGIRSAGVVRDESDYGNIVAGAFQDSAKRQGIALVGQRTVKGNDYEPAITFISETKPELLFLGMGPSSAGTFIGLLRQREVKTQLIGADSLDSAELAGIAGDSIVGGFYVSSRAPSELYPDAKKFVEDYKRKFGKDPPPFSAHAHDAAIVGLNALRAAFEGAGGKKPTREQVSAALRKVRVSGPTGSIGFNDKGDLTQSTYFIVQVISGDPRNWERNKIVKTVKK